MDQPFDKLKSLGYIGSPKRAPMEEQPVVRVKMWRVPHLGWGMRP